MRDAVTLKLIRAAVAGGTPVLAICRGLQEFNVALGGSLHQRLQDLPGRMDHSTPMQRNPRVRTGKAHRVRVAPGSWLYGLAGRPRSRSTACTTRASTASPPAWWSRRPRPTARSRRCGRRRHPASRSACSGTRNTTGRAMPSRAASSPRSARRPRRTPPGPRAGRRRRGLPPSPTDPHSSGRLHEPTTVIPPPAPVAVPVAGGGMFPVRRVFCVGRNYAAHAREMGADPDREPPFFFLKPADALLTGGADMPYPPAYQRPAPRDRAGRRDRTGRRRHRRGRRAATTSGATPSGST